MKSIQHEKYGPARSYNVITAIWKPLVSGSFSGFASTLLLQPLDLIKTRVQAVRIGPSVKHPLFDALIRIKRNEGFGGYYRGIVPSLYRIVPGLGIYFLSINSLGELFAFAHGTRKSELRVIENGIIGASARSIATISVLPFTVIKARFESGFYSYSSVLHAFRQIFAKEGYRGLFSGLSATVLRDAPASGLYLAFYRYQLSFFPDSSNSVRPFVNFFSGINAGLFASIVTHPFDMIKTQIQLSQEPLSFRTAARKIYDRFGAAGFMRGITLRASRRALMAACSWTFYEELSRLFKLS